MNLSVYDLFFSTGNQDKLLDYLDHASYDEMGQVDLNHNGYHHIHHTVSKYYVANINGTYRDLYEFVINRVVHPGDKEAYADLMDPAHMKEKMEASPTKNFRHATFRYKTQVGNYRYVEQVLIGGKEFGFDKGIYRFYIFDVENQKQRELEGNDPQSARHPEVGLFSEKAFFAQGQLRLDHDRRTRYCLLAFDIEHFTLFNTWFGTEKSKALVLKVATLLKSIEHDDHIIAGYFGFDRFALLAPYDQGKIEHLYEALRSIVAEESASSGFKPGIGVYVFDERIPIVDAYDSACAAVEHAKHGANIRIAYYRPDMHIQTDEESEILTAFAKAKEHNEITFYIQPQVRLSTSAIVGGEALARWIKPDGTLISPAEFVPILEKSGFIVDLDVFIWDKVCAYLRSLVDQGIEPLPISVNVSQVDIHTLDVAAYMKGLIQKYGLSPKYLKVEITESAYAASTELIRQTVTKLREEGFMVYMDDFGSGYSSLNMLSSINVDVIKLDALFLKVEDENKQKGIHLLESVIGMAKSLGVPYIVEGVETKAQCDFLEGLGTRYVQGFCFYKAIPVERFTKLIQDEKHVDRRGIVMKTNEQFRLREFLDRNIYSDSMLNQILGPVAIYLWHGEDLDIIRFNEQFYETVGVPDFHERLRSIQRFMPPDDIPVCKAALQRAIDERANGCSVMLHFYKTDGTLSTYEMHFFYLGEQDEGHRFYGAARNVTRRAELEQQMGLITRYSSDSILFLRRIGERWAYTVVAHGMEHRIGMDAKSFEDALNDRSFFDRLQKTSYQRSIKAYATFFKDRKSVAYTIKFKNLYQQTVEFSVRIDPVEDPTSNVMGIITFREKA